MRDYGERTPSDLDDVKPASPLDGLAEKDYSIGGTSRIPMPASQPNVAPDPGVPYEPEVSRTEYAGVVVRANGDRYDVLLQTGKRVTATPVEDVGYNMVFLPGDAVVVVESQKPDTWYMIGQRTRAELLILDYTTDIPAGGYNAFKVPFNVETTRFPQSGVFSNDGAVALKGPGTFQVEESGTYEIEYTVAVDLTNPSNDTADNIDIQAVCVEAVATASVVRSGKIEFDKAVGFQVGRKSNCVATVTIDTTLVDSVLNKQPTSIKPFWSQILQLGGSAKVGTQVAHPWITIGKSAGYAGISHGGGAIMLRLPATPPSRPGCVLAGTGVNGLFVQTDWVGPGVNNQLRVVTDVKNFKVDFHNQTASFEVCYETLSIANGIILGPGTFPGNRPVNQQVDEGQRKFEC